MTTSQATESFESVFADPFRHSSPARPAGGLEPPSRGRVPGEAGIWVFIVGVMLVFANFFIMFVYARSRHADVFEHSRRTLHLAFGAVNTLLLLTGSLFVVLGVQAVRRRAGRTGSRWFLLALLCGSAFVIDKVVEYSSEIHAGHTVATNDFFMYYFVFTGIHVIHLILGLIGLLLMARIARKQTVAAKDVRNIEAGASYWHLVDLLWIILFPLLYLAR
jgi:nitric oxide reductase NorE protein